jgi:signal transduction histidine kinase
MIRLFSYSLSLRLLAIFLLLAVLFAWGVVAGIRWAYSADDLRTVISGHLSLHIDYVRKDIGSPPRLDRALEITRRVPVDIHIVRFEEGGYDIVVVTPKIADQRSRPPLVPILVGFALLLVLCAYLAVRGLFRPVATIRQGAAYIGAGHFGYRIRTRRDDELGELAEDINHMAGKVEGMLDAKRELLLGVSHELRSPISRMTLGLALLDETPSVRALQQDLAEMRSIVETLLDAERLGSQHAALQVAEVSLAELVQELQSRYFAGEERLRISVTGEPRARLDAARIQLMLKNLVGNALRYSTAADGPVMLSIHNAGGKVEFRVQDHGPGIPADQRAHIGEPFYRSDASRARETGGTGLGLYLARQVARAHGGDLLLQETTERGALFVVTIPDGEPGRS